MISQLRKRDGRIVSFEKSKIEDAVYKAASAVGGRDRKTAAKLADEVVRNLEAMEKPNWIPAVEEVQDVVEKVLIESGHAKTAKAYILYRQRRAELREEKKRVLEKEIIDEVDKNFDLNALRVLKARYLRKDESGKLVETPKQLFTRVAVHVTLPDVLYDERIFDISGKQKHPAEEFNFEHVSIGEYPLNQYHFEALKRMYDRFNSQKQMKAGWSALVEMIKNHGFDGYGKNIKQYYDVMVQKKFLPNTPAIANFGNVLGMGSACFHPNQLISTVDGPKKISEVKVGDEVLTHRGRFRKVKQVFIREADSLLSFKCRKLPKPAMLLTDEHPIFAFKDGETGWYPAYMIKEGDRVALSYPAETKDVEKIMVSDIVGGVTVENDECYYEYRGGKFNAFVHNTKSVKNTIEVDYDLMKIFGFYLSEGNVSNNDCVRFTLSSEESNYCKEIISIIENKFGITARIEANKNPERKWLSLRFHSTILAKFFENIFGTGYDKKKIPSWILALPAEKQKGLMSGMIRGDGTVFKNWNKMNARLVMSNSNLVYAFWQMCMRCGVFAALGKESMPKLARIQPTRCTLGDAKGQLLMNELFTKTIQETVSEDKTFIVNGIVFTEVENIEKIGYEGAVYNLEVEEDHSYVANMVSVHNCFVLGIDDSMESIMDTLKNTAIIHKAGGGTGFNFSNLRPEGDYVSSTSGVASGPLSFMRLFDTMTEVVKQGGIRRGANMGIMNSNHPDIEKFIKAKDGNKGLRNFNISVLIMPDFWEYYEKNEPYPLINPRTGETMRTTNPRMLFDMLVYQAWESAEPGVIFHDTVNKYNPFLKSLGPIVTTNPCLGGNSKIETDMGIMTIKEISEKYGDGGIKVAVDARMLPSNELMLRGKLFLPISGALKTGEKNTVKIKTKNGFELICTHDHKIMTNYGWVEAEKLTDKHGVFVNNQDLILDSVESIVYNGIEEVYDIQEPLTHSFIANGIVVHNCGEVLLYPNEPCNLGSINVWAFAKEDDDGNLYYDWNELKDTIVLSTKFLDNVIDVNKFPLKQIEEMSLNTRKIGLGVMGVGDLLYELGIPYNSEEGRKFMEKLMEFINYYSKVTSIELARARGPLPFFGKSFYPEGRMPLLGFDLKEEWQLDWAKVAEEAKKGIRNGFTIVIAPTGSISMIAGCSSGIEPVYSLVFEKNVKVGSFYYIDPVFEKVMRREGLYDEDLMAEINANRGSLQNIPYIPKKLKEVFVTAMDTTPENHIRALASFQKWVDSSISKTNNFPADATVEDMRQSYILAYKLGCKDVTVFRDTSIKDQVLVAPKKKEETDAPKKKVMVTNEGSNYDNTIDSAKQRGCPSCSTGLQEKEGCLACPECGWGLCSA